jgi:hypothetical protein
LVGDGVQVTKRGVIPVSHTIGRWHIQPDKVADLVRDALDGRVSQC